MTSQDMAGEATFTSVADLPTTPRLTRWLAASALMVVTLVGGSDRAAAHTSLVTSVPGDGEIVERTPDRLQLTFATEVDPASLRVELRRGGGRDLGALRLVDPDSQARFDVAAELPDLAPGPYVASWVSIGPDGHRANGEVAFGIGAVALADLRAAAAGGGGLDLMSLVSGLARWALAAALALAAG
ncbi:MAG: copper resistance CopC family protein, partial [Acidimicrobiales bacterium]